MIDKYLDDLQQTARKHLTDNGYTGREFVIERSGNALKCSLKLGLEDSVFKANYDKFATLDFSFKTKYRISIKGGLLKQIDGFENTVIADAQKFKQVDCLTLDKLFDIAKSAFLAEIKAYTPSYVFGCCSKYKECSDAEKCIHEYKLYAKGCQYRQNLEKGLIFYGDKRNV